MANNLGNMGVIFSEQDDLPIALDIMKKALKINEEIGNREGMANQLGNMGIVFRVQGDIQKALYYNEKHLK